MRTTWIFGAVTAVVTIAAGVAHYAHATSLLTYALSTVALAGLALAPAGTARRGTGTALDALANALRSLPVPVIGRVSEDHLLLDMRCLEDATTFEAQLPTLRELLA